MALARCSTHGCPKGRGGNIYRHEPVKPVGYPETAAMCGRSGCEKPALIWLLENEYVRYEQGERVFDFSSKAVRVRVE